MALQSFLRRSRKGRGFTLVELAIVLAVASLLFAGLWRLMAGGSTQMRDQAAADQMKQLISAVQQYLKTSTEGQQNLRNLAGGGTVQLDLGCGGAFARFCDYRPAGFTAGTTNSYNQQYSVFIRRDDAGAAGSEVTSYSFMILTTLGDVISDASGGRISGLIGNDGGFIYNADVCNLAAGVGANTQNAACGSYGAWAASVVSYNPAGGSLGHLATRTANVASTDVSMWLARRLYPPGCTPPTEFNTMHTDLFFEASPLAVSPLSAPSAHDLLLANNTVYGGTTKNNVGGMIQNLQFMSMGSGNQALYPDWNSQLDAVFNVTSPCKRTLDPVNCKYYAGQFNGDVNVKGYLSAASLYASYFIYETSDERLKHEIKPLENSLDNLAKIRALSFLMNDSNEKKMGVIAQEVEKVYPELIRDIGEGYKGVDYMGFIGPLIGAIHELKADNDALRAQVNQLNSEVKKLKKSK